MPRALTLRHAVLALAVVLVWGSNFVVIRIGLDALPPLLFAALRFVFALVPAAFFLPRPRGGWGNLAAYGTLTGAGQFGLLFIAMRASISPGLASLVIQVQVFFTIGLAVLLAGERVAAAQWLALTLALAGIGVIAVHAHGTVTPTGLALVGTAALCWACGNMLVRVARAPSMVAYVVWASLFAVPPLLALSFALEGWPAIRHALAVAGVRTWLAVLWQSLGNALFGYGAWGFLLARYPAAVVTPWALLVPVVGMATSAAVLGEAMPAWKLLAAALVLAGLLLGMLAPRRASSRVRRSGA